MFWYSHKRPSRKRLVVGLFLTVAAFFWHQTVNYALAEDKFSSFRAARLFADPDFFPIGVYLQQPKFARQYKELGINLYVGLWKGPTAGQLAQLKNAGMPVIADQNVVGLTDRNRDMIVGWFKDDEPDNAQKRKIGWGYGDPIPPSQVVEHYKEMKSKEPTRPVLMNLGQGVAWDLWQGRGVRTNHPEDYREYVKGGDIVSFDIYPVTHPNPLVTGRLELVAKGVSRLKKWAGEEKTVWNIVGASRIANLKIKPTPEQIRSQVWLSIISGSRGIIYFVHQFKPKFNSASILSDPPLRAALGSINRRIQRLAAVIKGPDTEDLSDVTTTAKKDHVSATTRRTDCYLYIFSSSTRGIQTIASFSLRQAVHDQPINVLDEDRRIPLISGRFSDNFGPYDTHLYKIATSENCP